MRPPVREVLPDRAIRFGSNDLWSALAHLPCTNAEVHFGVLGERRRGVEVLEFWEIFVGDLYDRLGGCGIPSNAGILPIE